MVRVGAALWQQAFDQLAAVIVVVFAQACFPRDRGGLSVRCCRRHPGVAAGMGREGKRAVWARVTDNATPGRHELGDR